MTIVIFIFLGFVCVFFGFAIGCQAESRFYWNKYIIKKKPFLNISKKTAKQNPELVKREYDRIQKEITKAKAIIDREDRKSYLIRRGNMLLLEDGFYAHDALKVYKELEKQIYGLDEFKAKRLVDLNIEYKYLMGEEM